MKRFLVLLLFLSVAGASMAPVAINVYPEEMCSMIQTEQWNSCSDPYELLEGCLNFDWNYKSAELRIKNECDEDFAFTMGNDASTIKPGEEQNLSLYYAELDSDECPSIRGSLGAKEMNVSVCGGAGGSVHKVPAQIRSFISGLFFFALFSLIPGLPFALLAAVLFFLRRKGVWWRALFAMGAGVFVFVFSFIMNYTFVFTVWEVVGFLVFGGLIAVLIGFVSSLVFTLLGGRDRRFCMIAGCLSVLGGSGFLLCLVVLLGFLGSFNWEFFNFDFGFLTLGLFVVQALISVGTAFFLFPVLSKK